MKAKSFSATEITLLDAYIDLCWQLGINNVTLQKVAEKAGVAFGTVRYHFAGEGKLDLTQSAILHVVGRGQRFIEDYLYEAATAEKDRYNSLEAYVRGTFEWTVKMRKEACFLLYYYYLGSTRTELVVPNDVYLDRARARIAGLLHEAIGRGQYEKPDDIPRAVRLIHGLLIGCAVTAGTLPGKEAAKEQREIVLAGIEKFLKPLKKKTKAR